MNTPLVILVVALLGLIIVWLLVLRLWFARRARRRSMQRVPVMGASQPVAGSGNATPVERGVERGVWRPPPRRQLLDRQTALWLAGLQAEGDADAWQVADDTGAAEQTARSKAAKARLLANRQPANSGLGGRNAGAAVRGLGIGRKRRGLETLITEVPSPPQGASHDPNKR